jgi:D-3-phosphoglycerate dehydrogenase / 2-oxoglutarate reductase
MMKVLITTIPFGEIDPKPLDLLKKKKGEIEYVINPLGRKLTEDDLYSMIDGVDILIAGTEPITAKIIRKSDKLKIISRVGIGVDSVDLNAAKDKGIQVSYTPDAPSPAVAELAIAHMLNLLRDLPNVEAKIKSGTWLRSAGERLANQVVGIIGTGRIGSRVLKHLQGFEPKKILVNDLLPNYDLYSKYNATFVEKDEMYVESDIITLHVPMTSKTKNLITIRELEKMKKGSRIINTSRGGIVNEKDLCEFLLKNKTNAAALDVFEKEPYTGPLLELSNCNFSCHLGSMTKDCRARMELEATEEVIRFINQEELNCLVPEEEYIVQKEMKM